MELQQVELQQILQTELLEKNEKTILIKIYKRISQVILVNDI
jgi:helix-turn-helix protein